MLFDPEVSQEESESGAYVLGDDEHDDDDEDHDEDDDGQERRDTAGVSGKRRYRESNSGPSHYECDALPLSYSAVYFKMGW